jgi:hypothetical protein
METSRSVTVVLTLSASTKTPTSPPEIAAWLML